MPETEAQKLTSFADSKGTQWTIELTVGRVRKVKQALGIDLIDVEGEGFSKLYRDPMALADCLYCLCEHDAVAREVSEEEFGERLAGDTLDDAVRAVMNAIVSFSPKHQREPMKMAMQKMEQLQEKQAAATIAWFNSESAANEMEKLITRTPGEFV